MPIAIVPPNKNSLIAAEIVADTEDPPVPDSGVHKAVIAHAEKQQSLGDRSITAT